MDVGITFSQRLILNCFKIKVTKDLKGCKFTKCKKVMLSGCCYNFIFLFRRYFPDVFQENQKSLKKNLLTALLPKIVEFPATDTL